MPTARAAIPSGKLRRQFLPERQASQQSQKYREVYLLGDLGWIDFDLGCSTVCPIGLGQVGILSRTGCVVRQDDETSQICISQPDPGSRADGPPCTRNVNWKYFLS